MKIAILTQPLHNNYGGLLQAYALQKQLSDLGHDVLTVDFASETKPRLWGIKGIASRFIKKFMLNKPVERVLLINAKEKRTISQHTDRFKSENIRTTQRVTELAEFSRIKNYNFDAYVVGSDQVWRPEYSPGMSAFFLDFLGDDSSIKRVAYAASFGVDHCDEFSLAELDKYSSLLQKFDAVGVRESSAVTLCKDHFGVEASHVIDPTMLLERNDYCRLVERDNSPISNGNMMVYVLDQSPEKQSIVDNVVAARGLKPYTVMPESDGVYPSVTQWLRGFMDAEYVVTDSFHGVVFSIIFNKQFIAIGNPGRGLARFTSLLNMFALDDRLISNFKQLDEQLINNQIDFSYVNDVLKQQKKFAEKFINDALVVR